MEGEDNVMKIYVGNINFRTDEDGLRKYFEGAGEVVEVKVIYDRETGRSRGFGFVTFYDAEGVKRAIADFDQSEFDGRTISVRKANPQSGGGRGGGGRGGGWQ